MSKGNMMGSTTAAISVKVTAQYACGHAEVIYLSGTKTQVRRKLAVSRKDPCSECLASSPDLSPARQQFFRDRLARIHAEQEAWRSRNPQRSETWQS